jgi:choline dehydrogenase
VVSELNGVGQNMHDSCNIGGPVFRVDFPSFTSLATSPEASIQFLTNASGPLTNPGGDFWAWEKLPQKFRTDFTNETASEFAKWPADWPELEFVISSSRGTLLPMQQTQYSYGTIGTILVAPTSRGNMTITSANIDDPPVISPNWLLSEADQQMAVAAYKRARDIVQNLSARVGDEVLPGVNITSDKDILAYIKDKGLGAVHHGSSTCKMGRDNDTMAVVDSKARVKGVQRLRVIDSSSFPFTPPGHTQGTTCESKILVAERKINH